MSREAKILSGILVIVVAGMIALFAFAGGGANTNSKVASTASDQSKLVTDKSHKQGSGKVMVVEFGDYQCPACGAAYPNIKKIQEQYQGKITFVFRNYPLPMHANAPAAAKAAEAAALQGKFWQMHDKLYETQSEWSEQPDPTAKFQDYAKGLGLDVDKFKTDSAGSAVTNTIAADKADGDALKINHTPTIYINGKEAADYSVDTMKSLIDQELKQ